MSSEATSSAPMDTEPTLQQQLARLIAVATARETHNPEGKGFPDAPIFDGSKPEELRTWILQLRNKLAAQPTRYPDDHACLRYAFNRLSGSALNLVRSYVSETTGRIRLDSLNALLDLLRQAFDDPDRTRTANREIRKLRQKNGTFAAYLAEFGRIIGDLNWNEDAQKEQLYEGLSDEIKDALVTTRPRSDSLTHFVQTCRELDNRIRARAAERAPSSKNNQRPPARFGTTTTNPPTPAPTTPKNPTGTNSGHYGAAPMDLSATQKNPEKIRIRQERMARGECLYCGEVGHFLRECPRRAAAQARRLTVAAADVASNPAPTPEAAISTEQSEN
jgi:hypothetical protein